MTSLLFRTRAASMRLEVVILKAKCYLNPFKTLQNEAFPLLDTSMLSDGMGIARLSRESSRQSVVGRHPELDFDKKIITFLLQLSSSQCCPMF